MAPRTLHCTRCLREGERGWVWDNRGHVHICRAREACDRRRGELMRSNPELLLPGKMIKLWTGGGAHTVLEGEKLRVRVGVAGTSEHDVVVVIEKGTFSPDEAFVSWHLEPLPVGE